jgi:hypothetical protein
MRRFLILLLVCLLPLQSLHVAVEGCALDVGGHAAVHWLAHADGDGHAHHHLDDGQAQQDDSAASQQHMSDHGFCHVTGALLAAPAMLPIAFAKGAAPVSRRQIARPDPDLEDPTRPPQAHLARRSI